MISEFGEETFPIHKYKCRQYIKDGFLLAIKLLSDGPYLFCGNKLKPNIQLGNITTEEIDIYDTDYMGTDLNDEFLINFDIKYNSELIELTFNKKYIYIKPILRCNYEDAKYSLCFKKDRMDEFINDLLLKEFFEQLIKYLKKTNLQIIVNPTIYFEKKYLFFKEINKNNYFKLKDFLIIDKNEYKLYVEDDEIKSILEQKLSLNQENEKNIYYKNKFKIIEMEENNNLNHINMLNIEDYNKIYKIPKNKDCQYIYYMGDVYAISETNEVSNLDINEYFNDETIDKQIISFVKYKINEEKKNKKFKFYSIKKVGELAIKKHH